MKLSPSVFCRYSFDSEAEEMTGQLLTPSNRAWLQNLASQYATERIGLKFDLEKPGEFVQRDAELQGQLVLLQFLIDSSAAAEAYFAEKQTAPETSNPLR